MRPASSREFVRVLTDLGATFVRHGKGDHDLYERAAHGRTYVAPVIVGRKELDVKYQKQVLRQLGLSRDEIRDLDR